MTTTPAQGKIASTPATELYLDLLRRAVTNTIYEDRPAGPRWYQGLEFDHRLRAEGKDWPSLAHTMVGSKRLANVQHCVERVLADGVPGDFAETGVWRGGVCIFMRGILAAHGVTDRRIWVADSFEGMPGKAQAGHPGDHEMGLDRFNNVLAVSLETVQDNFRHYGLLDEQVVFLPGWFSDTLASAPIEQLAVLRLDGDLYASTMDALDALYWKLSPGGYVIVDDYSIPVCRQAVEEYRSDHGCDDMIIPIDEDSVYWRKS